MKLKQKAQKLQGNFLIGGFVCLFFEVLSNLIWTKIIDYEFSFYISASFLLQTFIKTQKLIQLAIVFSYFLIVKHLYIAIDFLLFAPLIDIGVVFVYLVKSIGYFSITLSWIFYFLVLF